MQELDELVRLVNDIVDSALSEATQHTPPELNLDQRCARAIWRGKDWLAIELRDKRGLEYYGGFEYVSPEYINVLGSYIFYSIEDSRVLGHWGTAGTPD